MTGPEESAFHLNGKIGFPGGKPYGTPLSTGNFSEKREYLFVSLDEVEGNIEIRGKQTSLFPKRTSLKGICYIAKQNRSNF